MTHQSADFIIYDGEQYELFEGEFTVLLLNSYGIKPVMMSTGCYRGYQVRYSIEDDIVYLRHLCVNDTSRNYPSIGNAMPQMYMSTCGLYDNLHERLSISSFMVIGTDMVSNNPPMRYVHHYRIVYQLEFDQGKLNCLTDLSVKTALLRQQMDEIKAERKNIAPEQQANHRKEELSKLNEQIFSLTYGMKLPNSVKE